MLIAIIVLYLLGAANSALLVNEWDRPFNLRAWAVCASWPLVVFFAICGGAYDKIRNP